MWKGELFWRLAQVLLSEVRIASNGAGFSTPCRWRMRWSWGGSLCRDSGWFAGCFWILFACNTISRPSKWPTSIIILLEKSFVFFCGNLGRYLLGNASLQKRWVSFRNLCLKECLGVSAQDRFWGPQLHRAWLVAEVKVWTLETGIFPKTIWKELQETLISGGFPMG